MVFQFLISAGVGNEESCSAVHFRRHPMEYVLKITHCAGLHICEKHLATSGLFGEGKLFSGS